MGRSATLGPYQIRDKGLGLPDQLGDLDRRRILPKSRPRLSSDDGKQRAQLLELLDID